MAIISSDDIRALFGDDGDDGDAVVGIVVDVAPVGVVVEDDAVVIEESSLELLGLLFRCRVVCIKSLSTIKSRRSYNR